MQGNSFVHPPPPLSLLQSRPKSWRMTWVRFMTVKHVLKACCGWGGAPFAKNHIKNNWRLFAAWPLSEDPPWAAPLGRTLSAAPWQAPLSGAPHGGSPSAVPLSSSSWQPLWAASLGRPLSQTSVLNATELTNSPNQDFGVWENGGDQ